jgi:amino acid transporter
MSEELKDASKSLPKAMIATLIFNGILGWIALITVCFMIGDLTTVLNTPTGQPFVQIFFDTTKSIPGTCVLVTLILIEAFFGTVDNVAAASRQLFAFARDKGMPGHGWLARVEPRWNLPLNAIVFSWTLNVLVSLINIGSTIAFNVIVSLCVSAMVATYMISIGCMTVKRLRGEPLLPSYFSLGRFGLVVNAFSVLSMTLIFIMTFFPQGPDPTLAAMNWNALVFGSVVIFSVVYFVVRGRFEYDGPVEYVRKGV